MGNVAVAQQDRKKDSTCHSSDMGGFMVADNLANFTKTIKKYVMFCFFHNL